MAWACKESLRGGLNVLSSPDFPSGPPGSRDPLCWSPACPFPIHTCPPFPPPRASLTPAPLRQGVLSFTEANPPPVEASFPVEAFLTFLFSDPLSHSHTFWAPPPPFDPLSDHLSNLPWPLEYNDSVYVSSSRKSSLISTADLMPLPCTHCKLE